MEEFGSSLVAGFKVWGLILCILLSMFVVTIPLTGGMIYRIIKNIYQEHTLEETVIGFIAIPLGLIAIAAILAIGFFISMAIR